MPTNIQSQQRAMEIRAEERFADATVSLRLYCRAAHLAYQVVEDTDAPGAREAHGRMLYAEIALAAVRASAGDEGGRASLRALVAGWQPVPVAIDAAAMTEGLIARWVDAGLMARPATAVDLAAMRRDLLEALAALWRP